MADYRSHFQRFELKFLFSPLRVGELRAAIRPYCHPDPHNPGPGKGYRIYTLYLDTPTLAFHRAKLRDDPDRFKLRVRTYGPTGPANLEIKRKVVDVVQKRRVAVRREDLVDAVAGDARHLVGGQLADLTSFSALVALTGALPVSRILYEREAHVSTVDGYARVTFDRRLRCQRAFDWGLDGDPSTWVPVDGYWQYDGVQSPVIVEFKCETRVPGWMSHLIQQFALRKLAFSKYSKGIAVEHRRARALGDFSYV